MSNKARDWARSLPLASASEKAVLKELGDRADDKTLECFPSLDQLAFDTALSTRTVTAALKALEEKGLISRRRRYRGYQNRISGDVYLVNMGALIEEEKKQNKPRGRPRTKPSQPEITQPSPANVASNEASPLQTAGATFATHDPTAVEAKTAASVATHEPSSVATVATAVANVAPTLTEEPPVNPHDHHHPEITPEGIDTDSNDHGDLPRGRDDDDDDFDAERVMNSVLSGLDPRLTCRAISDRLAQSGIVDVSKINILQATLTIWQRKTKAISNPVAWVTQAIENDPHNPEFTTLGGRTAAASKPSVPPTADRVCATAGHHWIGQFKEICARCGRERPDWRHDRDAAMAAEGATAR